MAAGSRAVLSTLSSQFPSPVRTRPVRSTTAPAHSRWEVRLDRRQSSSSTVTPSARRSRLVRSRRGTVERASWSRTVQLEALAAPPRPEQSSRVSRSRALHATGLFAADSQPFVSNRTCLYPDRVRGLEHPGRLRAVQRAGTRRRHLRHLRQAERHEDGCCPRPRARLRHRLLCERRPAPPPDRWRQWQPARRTMGPGDRAQGVWTLRRRPPGWKPRQRLDQRLQPHHRRLHQQPERHERHADRHRKTVESPSRQLRIR